MKFAEIGASVRLLRIIGSLNFRLDKFPQSCRRNLLTNSTRLGFSIIKEPLEDSHNGKMQISRMTEEERVEEEFTFRGAWLNLFAKFVNLAFAVAAGLRNVSNVIGNNPGDWKINLAILCCSSS